MRVLILLLFFSAASLLAAEIVVRVPPKEAKFLQEASADLARCLGLIYGQEAEVVSAAKAVEAPPALSVTLALDPALSQGLNDEAFHIQSTAKAATLSGATPLAVQHACYALLEQLGCRWYFPTDVWEIIPRRPELALPALDLRDQPAYLLRNIWYGWGIGPIPENVANYKAWVRRNRMGGSLTGHTGHAYAGFIDPLVHFATNPEWFALVGGKRVADAQICVSHPEVRKRAIQRALDFFKRGEARMISMSPNDGAGWCECANCARLGTVSDQCLWLANEVADAIREPFPNRLVAMYAYAGTSPPPNIMAAPNVIIFIATAFNSVGFDKALEGWSQKAKLFGLREYYDVIIWNRDYPRWQIDRMAQRIPSSFAKGAIGISAESSNNWGPNGLNYHVASKLMWQPKVDVPSVLQDFYSTAFGPAAAPMQRYYERFKQGKLTTRMMALCLADLAEASALAPDPAIQRRLDHLKMYLHWMRLYQDHNSASRQELLPTMQQAMHYAWRIRTSNMVHSYGQYREGRIWRAGSVPLYELERFKETNKPQEFQAAPETGLDALKPVPGTPAGDFAGAAPKEDLLGGLDAPKEDAPNAKHPPPPTPEEIAANFASDIARYGTPMEVPERAWSMDLRPLPPGVPGAAAPETPAAPRYRIRNHFVTLLNPAGPVSVKVQAGFTRKSTGSYTLTPWVPVAGLGVDEMEQAAAAEAAAEEAGDKPAGEPKPAGEGAAPAVPAPVAPAAIDAAVLAQGTFGHEEPVTIELPAGKGPARFEFVTGGMSARVTGPATGWCWLLSPDFPGACISGTGRTYFFVPKGVRAFAAGVVTPDGSGRATFHDPTGKVVLTKGGNFAGGEEFAVPVPDGQDGAVWSFSMGGGEDFGSIYLIGVPPYGAQVPSQLLVPVEALP